MTRILIATPLYPPDVGGPATYAKGLEDAFEKLGVITTTLSYKEVMRYPSGVRQFVYAFQVFQAAFRCDAILALDTLSIGLPAVLIGRLIGVPVIVRVAGDRVWEHYVARANDPVPFPEFYTKKIRLSFSERISAWLTGWTFFFARRVVFSTRWQMDVRMSVYPITKGKSLLVENAYALSPHIEDHCGAVKTFLWAGRDIPLKNIQRMKEAFALAEKEHPDIALVCVSGASHDELLQKIQCAYALLLPSISEDSPNFLLEGLGCGKPFVTTMYNGLRDRIGQLGIFVNPLEARAIADGIKQMADNETHDAYVARINKFEIQRNYEDIAKDYLAIIKTL